MVNLTAKNTLAKLLAKEGITVQHGHYQTAFFDVERRVLGLPVWEDMDNVYDLLVGHEVGHALFTPVEGWHDAEEEIPGIPRAFVNIVEDIRIEKLIQRKYPGLVLSFKKGYEDLYNRDFFKIGTFRKLKAFNYKFADRLNMKAKLRDFMQVEFTEEELPLAKEAFAVETWEDVLAVCKKMVEYAEQEPQKEMPKVMMPTPSADGEDYGNMEAGEQNDSNDSQDNSEGQPQASTMEGGQADQESQETATGNEESGSSQADESEGVGSDNVEVVEKDDPYSSHTDASFRAGVRNIVKKDKYGETTHVIYGMTKQQWNDVVVPFEKVAEARTELHDMYGRWHTDEQEAWTQFESQNNRFTQVMAKEFEMKKAAWRNKRAQTARSGTLDTNRLHSYKYNDDIFKRITNIPDAKNHGLFMLIDWSGSMYNDLGSVIKQLMTLVSFCKKVNIPFEVYSFTSTDYDESRKLPSELHVHHRDIQCLEMFSTRMNKAQFAAAFRHYHKMAWVMNAKNGWNNHSVFTRYERMGGTPLDHVLTYVPQLLKEFRQKHNLQKVNFVCMTDGSSNTIESHSYSGYGEKQIVVDGRMLSKKEGLNTTELLLENVQNYCESSVGYFLTRGDRSSFRWAHPSYVNTIGFEQDRKQFLKDKFLHFKNQSGYTDYFILRSEKRALDTANEEFAVSAVAKKGEISRAFKKFQKSKKGNRVLATKFAEAVA